MWLKVWWRPSWARSRTRKFCLLVLPSRRDVIPDALRAAGAVLDIVDAYRNFLPETAPSLLRDALTRQIDAATFTSSSSVTHLAEAAAGRSYLAISEGPGCFDRSDHQSEPRELHWEPSAEASPSDVPGLIAAVSATPRPVLNFSERLETLASATEPLQKNISERLDVACEIVILYDPRSPTRRQPLSQFVRIDQPRQGLRQHVQIGCRDEQAVDFVSISSIRQSLWKRMDSIAIASIRTTGSPSAKLGRQNMSAFA